MVFDKVFYFVNYIHAKEAKEAIMKHFDELVELKKEDPARYARAVINKHKLAHSLGLVGSGVECTISP